MVAKPREIFACQFEGREPFTEWLEGLPLPIRAVVEVRIDRIEDGNFGDVKPVGEGVSELRVDVGPGYRVYFGQIGLEVHLISGGTKATQASDITSAKKFWSMHD